MHVVVPDVVAEVKVALVAAQRMRVGQELEQLIAVSGHVSSEVHRRKHVRLTHRLCHQELQGFLWESPAKEPRHRVKATRNSRVFSGNLQQNQGTGSRSPGTQGFSLGTSCNRTKAQGQGHQELKGFLWEPPATEPRHRVKVTRNSRVFSGNLLQQNQDTGSRLSGTQGFSLGISCNRTKAHGSVKVPVWQHRAGRFFPNKCHAVMTQFSWVLEHLSKKC